MDVKKKNFAPMICTTRFNDLKITSSVHESKFSHIKLFISSILLVILLILFIMWCNTSHVWNRFVVVAGAQLHENSFITLKLDWCAISSKSHIIAYFAGPHNYSTTIETMASIKLTIIYLVMKLHRQKIRLCIKPVSVNTPRYKYLSDDEKILSFENNIKRDTNPPSFFLFFH